MGHWDPPDDETPDHCLVCAAPLFDDDADDYRPGVVEGITCSPACFEAYKLEAQAQTEAAYQDWREEQDAKEDYAAWLAAEQAILGDLSDDEYRASDRAYDAAREKRDHRRLGP